MTALDSMRAHERDQERARACRDGARWCKRVEEGFRGCGGMPKATKVRRQKEKIELTCVRALVSLGSEQNKKLP